MRQGTLKRARAALQLLSRAETRKGSVVVLDAGTLSATIPREAFDLFLEVLGHMANGDAVAVLPAERELTTHQAAALLQVSRPFLVQLINDGKLEARFVGTHRRIKVAALQKYHASMWKL